MTQPGAGWLRLHGVSKAYRTGGRITDVLEAIDFAIAPGELVSLLGVRSCGKSTLLRLMAGLELPDGGEIRRNFAPASQAVPSQQPTRLCAGVVSIAGTDSPDRSRSARSFSALLQAQMTAEALLETIRAGVNACPDKPPDMQPDVFGRHFDDHPGIVLLDDPFRELAPSARHRMQDSLRDLQARQGFTAILATRDVEEALYLSNRVVVLSPPPSRVRLVISVPLTHPRARADELLDRLSRIAHTAMTGSNSMVH